MNILKSIKNWFGSKERSDIIPKKEIVENPPTYRLKKRIGNLTIVVIDNEILSKEDPEGFLYDNIDKVETLEGLKFLFQGGGIQEDLAKDSFEILRKNNLFEELGYNQFCIKGVDIPLPQDLTANFVELLEKIEYSEKKDEYKDQFIRLLMFWLKLLTSPTQDKDNVLDYCRRNEVRLSKTGNIIAYRNVVKYKKSVNNNKEYTFAEVWYNKLKKWKKNPGKYCIINDNNQLVVKEEKKVNGLKTIGTVRDIYLKGDNSKGAELYTSWHNRGKYTFPIPSLYKMENETPDPDKSNCSSQGLHAACHNWNYSDFGDTPVVVLVNPAMAIYAPSSDIGKFRTSEMYIVGKNPNKHGTHIDDDFIEEADKIYNDITTEQLKDVIKDSDLSKISIGEKFVPKTTVKDIKEITNILSKRVQNFL